MPANPKYLNNSPWHQFAKITAGLIGGYIITVLIHMNLPLWLPHPKEILITGIITFYMCWGTLMILPFLFYNGWKSWAIYLFSIGVLYVLYFFGNQNNPFV